MGLYIQPLLKEIAPCSPFFLYFTYLQAGTSEVFNVYLLNEPTLNSSPFYRVSIQKDGAAITGEFLAP